VDEICDDLAAEHDDLDDLVAPLSEADWQRATPAVGWAIHDQISHLTFFDGTALLALTDVERFASSRDALLADPGHDPSVELGRSVAPAELLHAWRTGREALIAAARPLDPRARIDWYGPPMSARSFITARLMETWAHGEDVADALGVRREPTHRLRHVAHIGVRTRDFAYRNRGLEPPAEEFRVVLAGPGGEEWTWGPADARQSVTGPALDFCHAVAQRRHRADLALTATGPDADRWLDIAQAFAGPPGTGRAPQAG
jgi:uncharacterized protein (TIGR03084 family)